MNQGENLLNSGGLTIQTAEGAGVNLGSLTEVRQILNEFAAEVVGIWQNFIAGDCTQQEAMVALTATAERHAAIWKGEREGFALPPWRTPPVLAGKIVAWVPGIGGQDPIRGYFLWLGRQILKGAQEVTAGMALEQAGPELALVLGDAAEKLAGVQP